MGDKSGVYIQRVKGNPTNIMVTVRPAVMRYVTVPSGCSEEEAERIRLECVAARDRGDLDTKEMRLSARIERVGELANGGPPPEPPADAKDRALPDWPGVYFVQVVFDDGAGGPIKVGVSNSSMASRVAGFSGFLPWKLRVLGWAPGGQQEEQSVHIGLRRHRMNGEWFRPDPFVLSFVEMAVRDGIRATFVRLAGHRDKKVGKAKNNKEMEIYEAWLSGKPVRRMAPT